MDETTARRAAPRFGLKVPDEAWLSMRGGAYEDFSYREQVRRTARLFDGTLGLLRTVRAGFAHVVLATSSEWRLVETALSHFRLAEYFDAVISGDYVTHKKPAPEPYLVAAWLLGVRPSSMVVIEDSMQGVCAARQARTHVIGLAIGQDAEVFLRRARTSWLVITAGSASGCKQWPMPLRSLRRRREVGAAFVRGRGQCLSVAAHGAHVCRLELNRLPLAAAAWRDSPASQPVCWAPPSSRSTVGLGIGEPPRLSWRPVGVSQVGIA